MLQEIRRPITLFLIKRKYAIVLLAYYTFYSVAYMLTFSPVLSNHSITYFIGFFGRKITPILLLCGFLALSVVEGNGKMNKILNIIAYLTLWIIALFAFIMIGGYANNIPFDTYTSNAHWNYIPVFEYVAFLFVTFYFLGKKIGYNYYNFFIVSLAMLASGFLYELPVYYKAPNYQPFHVFHAFYIEPTIIALLLLLFMIYKNKVKFGKLQLTTGIIFLVYSVAIFLFALDPNKIAFVWPFDYARPGLIHIILEGWLPRIPSLMFLSSIAYGFEKT